MKLFHAFTIFWLLALASIVQTSANDATNDLPQGAIARLGSNRLKCATEISVVRFSPDGKWIAAGEQHRIYEKVRSHKDTIASDVRVFSTADGSLRRIYSGLKGSVDDLAFSADSKRLAAAAENGQIVIWDRDSGKLEFEHPDATELFQSRDDIERHQFNHGRIAFAKTDQQLRISIRSAAALLNIAGEQQNKSELTAWGVMPGNSYGLNSTHGRKASFYSPKDQGVVTLNVPAEVEAGEAVGASSNFEKLFYLRDDAFFTFDSKSGKQLARLAVPGEPDEMTFYNYADSPTADKVVLSALSWGTTLFLYDIKSGRIEAKRYIPARVGTSFSPDGRMLAVSADCRIHLLNAATLKPIVAVDGPDSEVRSIILSPSGKYAALMSGFGSICNIYSTVNGKRVAEFHNTGCGEDYGAAFSRDDRHAFLFAEKGQLTEVDCESGKIVARKQAEGDSVARVLDSLYSLNYADVSDRLDQWSLPDLKRERTSNLDRPEHDEIVRQMMIPPNRPLALSPGGTWFASTNDHGTRLSVWNTKTGKIRFSVDAGASSIVFDPVAKRLACGRGDQVDILDAATGKAIISLSGTSRCHPRFWINEGRSLVAEYENSSTKVWNVESGKVERTFDKLRLKAISEDGKIVCGVVGCFDPVVFDRVKLFEVREKK